MLPRLASSLSLLALVLKFREIESKSGDYFDHYNQSSFSWSGSSGKCTLAASYGSGGSRSWYGCRYETKEYESQQEFDLEYYELLKVCPYLERVPPSYRGEPDYASKNSLPKELVWSVSCSANYLYCPRWQCDNSSSLWDKKYNKSYSYHEVTTLSFSSSPLESTCYQCECMDNAQAAGQHNYAWYCGSGYRYKFDPINEPNNWLQKECGPETDSPTPQPTASPIPVPTPSPTPNPVTTYCSNAWGYDFILPGSYFWDTDVDSDCSTVKLCYCQIDGQSYCQETWQDIMDDDLLYPEFLDRCTYQLSQFSWQRDLNYLADCWRNNADSVSRLFTWLDFENDPTTGCALTNDALCPRCGCTSDPFTQSSLTNKSYSTSVFDKIENETISRAYYVYEYKCTVCNCSYETHDAIDVPRGPLSWIDPDTCSHYDEINNNDLDLSEDCIDEPLKCYSNTGPYDAKPLFPVEECSGQRESLIEFENACSFERVRYDDSHPGDICVEDGAETIGVWGCADSFECELYRGSAAEDGCYRASFDYQVTQYDCINDVWLGDKYSVDLMFSCCADDHLCNNRTEEAYVDEERDCTKSTELSEYKSYSRECQYSQKNLYQLTDDKNLLRAAFCGDDLEYSDFTVDGEDDEETLCELLQVYWQYNTFCDCNEAKLRIELYNEAGIKDADVMQKYIRKGFWSSTRKTWRYNLETMYEYWNCADYNDADDGSDEDYSFFRCDWDSDVEEIENVNVKDGAKRWFTYWWYILLLLLPYGADHKLIFLSVTILFATMSAATDYSWSDNNGYYDDCEFRGSISSGTDQVCEQVSFVELQHQNEDLTWDVLVEACEELEQAGCYTSDDQLAHSDLVWPNHDNACNACPRCPCSNATDTTRHFVQEEYDYNTRSIFIRRVCYTCYCSYWSQAKEYAWDCEWSGYQLVPYALNDTEFCPDTARPTPAPTEPIELSCIEGSIGSYTTDTQSMSGESGYSHCAASNISIERYDDGEPHVCVYDELQSMLPNTYWMSANDDPVCVALGAKEDGCYWADFDMKLQVFDCALNAWVSDSYHVDATVFCCNDGYYCNNVTTVDHRQESFEYFNYKNETKSVPCRKSDKLKQLINVMYQCPYKDHGFDKEYVWARHCNGGKTKKKFGCDELRKYWDWGTKCSCAKAQFYLSNVNATYDEFLNDQFDADWETTREDLEAWNKTLGCDWAPGSRWYCSNAPAGSPMMMMIAAVSTIVFSLFFSN